MHIHNDWASTLLAINELTRRNSTLLNSTDIWKSVGEATKAEDDHQRHLALEVILKQCLAIVSEHTEKQKAKREGYDLSLDYYASRFKELYPYGNDRLAGVRYVSFYKVSRECYSPAEGGCWFDRKTLVATFPLSHFCGYGERDYDVVLAVANGEAARMELNHDCIHLETFPAENQTLRTPTYE
jgi:hypothetical protein